MTHVQKTNGIQKTAPMPKQPHTEPRYQHGQVKFTYALKQWSIERRGAGWFIAETVPSIPGNKPNWRGPFQSVENACRAIARGLALELTDRHTRSVESHKMVRNDPLYGLGDPKTAL